MRRVLNSGAFTVKADTAFQQVIEGCANTPRPGQKGTWITEDMEEGYLRLFELGYAHSIESWAGAELVGGLYGVSLGRIFFGESMFSARPNASKVSLVTLAQFVRSAGFMLIDAQLHTPHVATMGGREVPRDIFLEQLRDALDYPTLRGAWTDAMQNYIATRSH